MTRAPEQERENPLLEGLGLERTPEACALVIFGASGDLTRSKLIPALYALAYRRLLPGATSPSSASPARRAATTNSASRWRTAVKEHARDRPRGRLGELAEGDALLRHGLRATTQLDQASRGLRTSTRTRGTGGNRVYYLATRRA